MLDLPSGSDAVCLPGGGKWRCLHRRCGQRSRQPTIYALQATTGRLVWQVALPDSPSPVAPLSVAVTEKALYIPDLQGCCALPASTGDFLWKREMAASAHGSVIEHHETIYLSFSALDLASCQATVPLRHMCLAALHQHDGCIQWQRRLGTITSIPLVTPPVVDARHGALCVGAENTIYGRWLHDGSPLWKYEVAPPPESVPTEQRLLHQAATGGSTGDGKLLSTPIAAGGMLYVGANDGFVYALAMGDGSLRWRTFVGTRGMSGGSHGPLANPPS
jgi:outer membrane protein assembly factor BamB